MKNYEITNLEDLLGLHIKAPILDQRATRLTAPGENYGSLILKVDIRFKSDGKNETFYTVAKCVSRNKALQKVFNTRITFKNEIGWYTEVIPAFQEFQRENNVQNILDCFPKFYGSRLSLNPENNFADEDSVILLENMAIQGYKTKSRFEGFDLNTSKLILRKLASFHAISVSMKLKKPDIFNVKVKPYIIHGKQDAENFSSSIISYLGSRDEFKYLMPRINEALGHKFNDVEKAGKLWKSAIHNDFWINNILLKDSKIVILDFQTCEYGSIVLDLMFFLASSLNIDVARTHFDNLILFYYNEFVKNLEQYKINMDIFKYENFLNELKIQGKGSFARAIFAVLIVLGEEGKNHDPEDKNFDPYLSVEILKNNLTERQKEKCCFLVEEFVKRDWI